MEVVEIPIHRDEKAAFDPSRQLFGLAVAGEEEEPSIVRSGLAGQLVATKRRGRIHINRATPCASETRITVATHSVCWSLRLMRTVPEA
jgi:hypothetical protein